MIWSREWSRTFTSVARHRWGCDVALERAARAGARHFYRERSKKRIAMTLVVACPNSEEVATGLQESGMNEARGERRRLGGPGPARDERRGRRVARWQTARRPLR